MFAKIFSQIYDSSIVENAELRFTFMDLLVLSDCNGVVDMTHEAIARRTNRPIELIRKTIAELESPDSKSRTPEFDGARIKRLDEHRDWGWMIVNYQRFREIANEEQRRQKTLARVRKHRGVGNLEQMKLPVTLRNAGNAMQKEKQKQTQKEEEMPSVLNTDTFRAAWADWKTHRLEIKKPLTSTSIKSQLSQFAEWGERRAVAAIRFTIRKGWQGLREDDSKSIKSNGEYPEPSHDDSLVWRPPGVKKL